MFNPFMNVSELFENIELKKSFIVIVCNIKLLNLLSASKWSVIAHQIFRSTYLFTTVLLPWYKYHPWNVLFTWYRLINEKTFIRWIKLMSHNILMIRMHARAINHLSIQSKNIWYFIYKYFIYKWVLHIIFSYQLKMK